KVSIDSNQLNCKKARAVFIPPSRKEKSARMFERESLPISRLAALRRDIVRKVRQVGVVKALRQGSRRLRRDLLDHAWRGVCHADAFDCKYGTDTAAIMTAGALDVPDEKLEHVNAYEPMSP